MIENNELIKGTSTILILSLLKNKKMYGYEMIKAIETKSNDTFTFKEGSLYPLLHALEKRQLIESTTEMVGGRKRKYYVITEKGEREMEKMREEWYSLSSSMNYLLGEL